MLYVIIRTPSNSLFNISSSVCIDPLAEGSIGKI